MYLLSYAGNFYCAGNYNDGYWCMLQSCSPTESVMHNNAISMCENRKATISYSYRLSYGQVLGECGGIYQVWFLIFCCSEFSNFAQYLQYVHYGNLILPCHEHNHNCFLKILANWQSWSKEILRIAPFVASSP